MKKISKRCKNKLVSNYLLTLLRLYEALPAEAKISYFQNLINQLSADSEAMLKAQNLTHSSGNLSEIDKKRDKAVSAVKTLVQAALLSPVEEEVAAATQLKAVLDKFKGITTESYKEATSDIESLLMEIKSDVNKPLIANVTNLEAYVKALESAHEEFKLLSDSSTTAAKSKAESATSIKERVINLLNDKVCPFVTVSADQNPALYGEFDKLMSAEADKIMTAAPKAKAEKQGTKE